MAQVPLHFSAKAWSPTSEETALGIIFSERSTTAASADAPTRESTDPFHALTLKQEQLEICVEKGIARILDQQRSLETVVLDRIPGLGSSLRNPATLAKRSNLKQRPSLESSDSGQPSVKKVLLIQNGQTCHQEGAPLPGKVFGEPMFPRPPGDPGVKPLLHEEIQLHEDMNGHYSPSQGQIIIASPLRPAPKMDGLAPGDHDGIHGLQDTSGMAEKHGPEGVHKPCSPPLPVIPPPPMEALECDFPSDGPPSLDGFKEHARARVSINAAAADPHMRKSIKDDGEKIRREMEAVSLAAKRQTAKMRKNFKKKTHELGGQDLAEIIVENKAFDSVCALVIIINSVLIGASVQYDTSHSEESTSLIIASHICNAYFFIELVLRMWVAGRFYFCNHDMKWNIFDFSLVVFTVIDILLLDIMKWGKESSGSTAQIGSGLKIIKMLRIVRIFRVFRFFKELSLLALMIMDSMKSLIWALLMLTIIIYVFAICFTQGASDFLKDPDKNPSADVKLRFGSLSRTTYSLVQAMLNGVSWGVISDTLLSINVFLPTLFFFYISFTILAVMNIITGVFVDNAVETAKTEREFLVQKEMELKEKYVQEMRDLFAEMDEDGSGTITHQELSEYFDDARVQSYFQALGLDPSDTERLFGLMDDDGSGEVSVDEFLDGCLRLKGLARSIDVHTVLKDIKRLQTRLDEIPGLPQNEPGIAAAEVQLVETAPFSVNGTSESYDDDKPSPRG